jgi:integrase
MKTDAQTPLANHIEAYLAHKRALGKQLQKAGSMLHLLDRYLLEEGVAEPRQITPALLEGFMRSRPRHSSRSYNILLGTLRGLFDWLIGQEVLASSPLLIAPRRVVPGRRPFIFNADQARRLLDAAGQLPDNPFAPRRAEIYRMIFALLYGLGLRVGEVCRLCRKDVDIDKAVLLIRQTKFGKDLLVPFGPRMTQELSSFLRRRESCLGSIPQDCPLFSFAKDNQRPIRPTTISATFHKLIPKLNLIIPAGVAPPYLHCLRHSFAVGTLLRWYRAGIDPTSRLFDLSTFLGHVSPSSTAVYLTITMELLECASGRFARFAAPALKEVVR